MLVSPAPSGVLPSGARWAFEVKWDGVRLVAKVGRSGVQAWTRHGTAVVSSFPELRVLEELLPVGTVLDGELVVFRGGQRPDFAAVSRRLVTDDARRVARGVERWPATLVAFDLLATEDGPVVGRPWDERRGLLEALDVDVLGRSLLLSRAYVDGVGLWDATRELELEGVVAKGRQSRYLPGRRSRSWVKAKHVTVSALPAVAFRTSSPGRPAQVLLAGEGGMPRAWCDVRGEPARQLASVPVARTDRDGVGWFDRPVTVDVSRLQFPVGELREARVVGVHLERG